MTGHPARNGAPMMDILKIVDALIADEPPARDPMELVKFATARLGRTGHGLQAAAHALERLSEHADLVPPRLGLRLHGEVTGIHVIVCTMNRDEAAQLHERLCMIVNADVEDPVLP